MQLSHIIIALTSAMSVAASSSHLDILKEVQVSKCGHSERQSTIIIASMPERAPMTTDPSAYDPSDTLSSSFQRSHNSTRERKQATRERRRRRQPVKNQEDGSLTARQIIGGIAVAVLVACF